MVHEKQPDIGRKIYTSQHWGREGAVYLGRLRYRVSRKEVSDRITLMSTVYSAFTHAYPSARRGNPLALVRCLHCVRYLQPLIKTMTDEEVGGTTTLSADQCDTVSRILMRWSTIPLLGKTEHLKAAHVYASSGLDKTEPYVQGTHTRPHLLLTAAEIQLLFGNRARALGLVEDAEELAGSVTDANHKSRIYRDITVLYGRSFDDQFLAAVYIDAADSVPDIDPDVQFKNAEARRTLGL